METAQLPNFTSDIDLLPAIAQDAASGRVLMLGWMNRNAFEETMRTGRAVYFSRSRQRLWQKGETSGHIQEVQQVLVDCDGDAILLKVRQQGAACHRGYASCFFRQLNDTTDDDGRRTWITDEQPLFDPHTVYGPPTQQHEE